ncbi:MinD/ParA family protein [Blastopirellula marina]|uniref:CDP-3, 6-dideoxy-D-glycero-L-glycero-4-hexulose-4-reductase n=1 Tax=Blastopirellula marina TaxID=124 RepID=A0A2S8GKY1_9BACT|nr:MinD/ParA family protein [Blastopirellula marina]PQO45098.1 CDP-3,6-dideoxy-D-glycero-L-glycero-4-hexulose-4-reductase [Blastopirellula marina]
MAQIVSIHSFRGGTGKSNTTANLAVSLARRGYRVAVVDTDIQSPGVHVLFRLGEGQIERTLNDYLWGDCEIEEAAYDLTQSVIGSVGANDERPRIFLVPASIDSNEIGRVLKEGYDVGVLNDGFKRLIRQLNLDYLLIDTHPGVNEETLLSIVVSDKLVLVMRPDSQDFQGTAVTLELARRLEVADTLLVINKIPPGMDRDTLQQKVETAYDAKVVALLPLNHEIVHLASNGIFANRYPDHPFTLELQNVVNALIQ